VITKRQLGIFLALVGLLGAIGVVAVDLLGAGEWSGFGPLQRLGVGAGVGLIAVGIALIAVGNRPA
jgi:hypothetical protein